MSTDTIKEFLVALGFKVDESGLKKFETGVGKATKVAATLGAAAIAAASAVEASMIKISGKLDQLYFSSKRTQSAAQNIEAFGYAVKQLGGSADSSLSSLENFAGFLRNTPSAESFLKGLGVNTRDGNGKMRENLDILKDVGVQMAKLRDQGKQPTVMAYAGILGIDEKTMLALQDGSLTARMEEYRKTMQKMGYNADDAAKKFHEFQQKGVGPLMARLEVLVDIIALRLLPIAEAITKGIIWLADAFAWLDKKTGGVTTVIFAVMAALGALFLLCASVGIPVFSALGVAVTAATWPFILLAALAAAVGYAIGAAAGYIVNHWSDVKQWFADFFGWFERKWAWFSEKYDDIFGKTKGQKNIGISGPQFKNESSVLPGGSGGGGGGGSADPNAKATALQYFEKMGWTSAQAAGIVANLVHESGLRPGAVGDNGKALGIAQWHPDRQAEFARVFGKSMAEASYEEQLAFVQHELTKGNEQRAGRALAGTNDPRSAADVVNRLYERSRDLDRNSMLRGNTANQLAQNNQTTGPNAVIHQKTDIHVSGASDPRATAAEVARQQGWVNGTLVRNTEGALS